MTVAPQADTEIIVGTVSSVEQKAADKWQVHVQTDGSQFTKGLWTKDPAFAQAMMNALGQRFAFQCGASHWNRADGTPVRSLWLNGWGDADGMAAAQPILHPHPQQPVQTAAQPAPSMPASTQAAAPQRDLREEKIHRQTATKVAVDLLKYLTPEHHSFDNLIRISERLVAYYDHGVKHAVADDDSGPGLSPADDGIPF